MTATAALKHGTTEDTTVHPARWGRANDVAVVVAIAVVELVWMALLGYGLLVVT